MDEGGGLRERWEYQTYSRGGGGDAGWVTPGVGSGRRRRHMTTTADGWTPQAPAAAGRTTIFF